MLLHDDGRHLLAVSLDGSRRVLWTHPRIDTYEIAATPGGDSLAISARVGSRGFLYELTPDGNVVTVDETAHDTVPETPIFVHAPTDPRGPLRLYWIRLSQDYDGAVGRFRSEMMMLEPEGRQRVDVPLRFGESLFQLSAYPGAPTASLALFRRIDTPTRYEILRSEDYFDQYGDDSLRLWGNWVSAANTDVGSGVAWLNPRDYVIGVGQSVTFPENSLRLFRVGCEFHGSHVITSGRRIDVSYSEALWPMLALDPSHILVIARRAAARVSGGAGTAPWLEVDVRTGVVTTTHARWGSPQSAWTVIRPIVTKWRLNHFDCSGVPWSFP